MLSRWRGGEKNCSENAKRTNERADLCPMGTNAGAATPPPTKPPPPQAGGDMGVWRGTTGEGASKKSRSGSSKMESTARIAMEAPRNPPFELLDEEDDLLQLLLQSWAIAGGAGAESVAAAYMVFTLADDVAVDTDDSDPTLDISSAWRALLGHCCSTCWVMRAAAAFFAATRRAASAY